MQMHVTLKAYALCSLIVNSYSELANRTSLTDENKKQQGNSVCRVCKLYTLSILSIVNSYSKLDANFIQ